MEQFKTMLNQVHNMDCVEGMKKLPDGCVDIVCTSPPYNVNIPYDVYEDNMPMDKYLEWTKEWLTEVYRTLKDDGRIAINVPIELNIKERGGRIFMSSEIWQVMKEVGFKFFGMVDLQEKTPHRVRQTAWGSWMSPSAPYIYNPKECVILAYKKDYKKKVKGIPEWDYVNTEVENEDGTFRTKRVYSEIDKNDFMELVFGRWHYQNDTKSLTKATYSLDIPMKALKILTYKGDICMDPFSGSGTTFLACKKLKRQFIGFELSENYTNISNTRMDEQDSLALQDTV